LIQFRPFLTGGIVFLVLQLAQIYIAKTRKTFGTALAFLQEKEYNVSSIFFWRDM